MARVVLLAGASGSGKTSLCRRLGIPVLTLDDFYRDHDDDAEPTMPQRFGIVDWDHPASWHHEHAVATIEVLCRTGAGEVPNYDIPSSRRRGTAMLDLDGAPLFVAEGIFAAELVPAVRARGLLADALCLNLHPAVTFVRRLVRDLSQARKPPLTLIRRGLALARGESALLEGWIARGCRPVTPGEAEQVLRRLLLSRS